ncbi:MAG: AraC family transcriptional regulator [Sphingobium sp.]
MEMEHFSTRLVPVERRCGYWRDLVAETFPGMTVRADEGLRANLSRWQLGCVGLAVARSDRARVERSPGAAGERNVVLHLQRSGRMALTQRGRTTVAPVGSIVIADDSEPYVIDISDRNDCLILTVPTSALGEEACGRDWRAVLLDGEDTTVALFRRMLEGLWAEANRHEAIDSGFNAVLLAMVRLACEKSSDTRDKNPNCPPIAFALKHLRDPALSTEAIADGTGMSARGVQKAFLREVGQTPMAFIVDRRLARAAEMLACEDGRSVTDIAFEVGFGDSGSFSRSFRRRYEVAPSRWTAERL